MDSRNSIAFYKKNGLYMLSSNEIDCICEKLIFKYNPSLLENAQPFDIETFLEFDQKANIDYFQLTPDMKIYGCAVAKAGFVPFWNSENQCMDQKWVEDNTIVIDERLSINNNPRNHALLRTVLAHEYMHLSFQAEYLRNMDNTIPNFHVNENHYRSTLNINFCDGDICEWQANRGGIGLLMNKKAVLSHIDQMLKVIPAYDVFPEVMIQNIARTFNVTNELAYYRLVDLPKFVHIFGRVELKNLAFSE